MGRKGKGREDKLKGFGRGKTKLMTQKKRRDEREKEKIGKEARLKKKESNGDGKRTKK